LAGGWYDAYVDVSSADMQNNLLFELEDTGRTGALDAVSVYMWAERIPLTRKSEYFTARSYNNVYSLAISMHEFEPFIEHGSSSIRLFFGVWCGQRDTTFRSFVSFVKSKLDSGHAAHGEVCPGEWVYHYLPIDSALIDGARIASNSSSASYVSSHRRRRLAEVAAATDQQVHVKMHIIKNTGSMNLMVDLNDKPLRLIPTDTTYMLAGDTVADKVICNVDRFYRSSSEPMRYYLAINGGEVCAQYEVVTEAFTSSCAEAQAAALQPSPHETDTHVSAGARECPQGATGCVLSMRHYMRASSSPGERAPPFAVNIPYEAGQSLDNLVIEVEDLNPEDNPTSLEVALYQTCGKNSTCTHTTLERSSPLATTDSSRQRIFSIGLSSLDMHEVICGGECRSSGTYTFFVSVRGASAAPVRFQVISILTSLRLEMGVPVHGEVCPGNWIFHRVYVPDTKAARDAGGLRFNVHVHTGDVYFAMSRWAHPPLFTSCNANELSMSEKIEDHVDLCQIADQLDTAYQAGGEMLQGHIGLYGGAACAHYTIEVMLLPANSTCSTETTGTCDSFS